MMEGLEKDHDDGSNVVIKTEVALPFAENDGTLMTNDDGCADVIKADENETTEDAPVEMDATTTTTITTTTCRRVINRCTQFYWDNEFLILIVFVILVAKAYPPLGAIYLAPQITATWIAVMFIFLLAGLGLKTEEFSKAFTRIYSVSYTHLTLPTNDLV